jgi:P-type Cu2+ transporter
MGTPAPTNLDQHGAEVLAVALALAEGSSHPLAQALARALRDRALCPPQLEGVTEQPGYGIEAQWQGVRVRWAAPHGWGPTPRSVTAAYLAIGAQTHAFTFADQLRPGAAEVVPRCKRRARRCG